MNMSYSFLKDIINKGVLYAIDRKENRINEYNFGSMAHCLLLEPEKFEKEYFVGKVDRRTKVGKEKYAELLEKGIFAVSENDFEKAKNMVTELKKVTELKELIDRSKKEWLIEKKIDGQNWKGFVDIYDEKNKVVYDYKTCGDVDERVLMMQIHKFKYDMQAYLYSYLTGAEKVKFIFQETAYPYYFTIVELDFSWIERGKFLTEKAFEMYKEHCLNGENTFKGESYIDLPKYLELQEGK